MQQVAAHDAPIRRMAYISELNMLVTGGWDRTLRYWDLRSPNAVHVHQLPERCYALSLNFPLLVVGTAERHIEVSDKDKTKKNKKRISLSLSLSFSGLLAPGFYPFFC